MKERQFITLLGDLRGRLKEVESTKIIYLLIAWKKLSHELKREEQTFEYFYNQKIEVKKFQSIIKDLSKSIKVFELFLNQNIKIDKIQNNELIKLLSIANDEVKLPNIFDIFYSIFDGYMDFSVANQIADFGIKLLDGKCNEIYAPFSNGYNMAYYTNKRIIAESYADEFVIELMKIIDNVNIDFTFNNPLDKPNSINTNAPHLLRQFDCILSFPPMGLATNKEFIHTDKFNRFKFHKVKSNRDVAHFEHILAQTKDRAVVLMPVGFTYRGNQDEEFRKYLIENNWLEGVIQLPPNLHNATSIETTFIIINKQKQDDNIYFLNLKHESFGKREGRKLVLKDIDNIVSLYETNTEIENISKLIKPNEIEKNNYSLAIDRYIISKEIEQLQNRLKEFKLVKLEDIADIRRSQLFKDEGDGKEIYEVSPSDFSNSGFTLETGKVKQIGTQYNRLDTYKLEPYDVLLSTKGTIGKVAIVGEISDSMIASQAIQVIKLKGSNKKENAISLYMFLKSTLGQTMLSTLVSGVAMPQISTLEIKKLQIPVLSANEKKQLLLNFNNEIKMYNEINKISIDIKQIHNNFLGVK